VRAILFIVSSREEIAALGAVSSPLAFLDGGRREKRSRRVFVTHYVGIDDDGLLSHLWALYQRAYERRPPEVTRELLSAAEFHDVLGLASTQTWVVWDDDDAVGLLVAETRLERSPWLNAEYLARQFPEQTSSRKVAYVTTLAVDPSRSASFVARRCMAAGVDHFAAEQMVLVFDVTDHLQTEDLTGGMAGAAQALVKRHDADVALVGVTRYYVADFSRRPA
jgi:ribosomal protein S18 acetylase RimI-like enzyme